VKKYVLFVLAALTAMLFAGDALAETYVTKANSHATLARVNFAPDNTKQVVVRHLTADTDLVTSVVTIKFAGTKTTTNIAGVPAATGGTGQSDLPVVSNTGFTTGDRVYVYLISGASAGNGWDDTLDGCDPATPTTMSLTSNLVYTCPYGTYVYPMTVVTGGTIPCGTVGLSLSNASGIIAAPRASPLVLELNGTNGASLYSVMAVYAQ